MSKSESVCVDSLVIRRVISARKSRVPRGTTRLVKDLLEASEALGATEVVLRARGMWMDERGVRVDLTQSSALIRDVKSVWVYAYLRGSWTKICPDHDPSLSDEEAPCIEMEIRFPESLTIS